MKNLFGMVTLFSLVLASCTQAPVPVADTRDADLKAIHDVEESGKKAWAAKDVDGIMAQYASDASLVVTNAPVAKGLQEIRGMLVDLMKDPGLSIEMGSTMTEVAKSGDIGYQRGYYTLHVTDQKTKKPITESGTSLLVYKKQQDGSWKISEDINVAGPAAAAPK